MMLHWPISSLKNLRVNSHNMPLAAGLLLVALLLFSHFSQAAMRQPSANRECATCHIMWLTEFKQEDIKTLIPYDPRPTMPSGKQDVSSTEPICFSCHDGFVLESRFLWEPNKHAHPVGKKPSEKINIPIIDGKNLFPLNDDGKIYCGSCHTAHGVNWNQKKTAVFMRVANEDGQLCMACHKEKTKGPQHGSHPLKRKIQKLLDEPPEKLMTAGARFAHDGEVVCQSCHKPHGAVEEKILLLKNDKSQLCGACHVNRYAKNRDQAGKAGTHPVNIKPENAKVPEQMLAQGAKLGSDGELICETCHRPHNAQPKTSLLVRKNVKDSLCQDCHKDKRTVNNSKHDMRLADEDSINIRKQPASLSGPCSACHVPHKGTGPKMWARDRDQNQDTMASLCLSCHNKEGLAKKHTVGEYSHPVGVNISKLGRSVPLPTFSDSGIKWSDVERGKVSCASCHDPHQWDPNNIHNVGEHGDDGDNTNRFLRITNGPETKLCKTCHEDKWSISNTKHDMRKMAPDAENALGQTVAESGLCGSCHLVHNARGNRLWARNDLSGQGTGFIACFGCHNDDGLASEKTISNHSHPVNVSMKSLGIDATIERWISDIANPFDKENLLGGEPIPLPLYDSTGKPVAKGGRVGCGTCHDPHTWTQLDEPKAKDPKTIEGDSGNSFLRIADKSLSLLCVNCHIDKKGIFFSKHDLTELEGKYSTQLEENQKGDLEGQHLSGPCMHCHRPHNAKGPALWTRGKGPGETAIAALCTDCHQKDNLAADKLPGKHTHPLGKDASHLHHDKRIPTFAADGGRKNNGKGNVDCASCHDPHRWNPDDNNDRGLAILSEDGDTSNSFLRLSANKNSALCITCHADKKTIIGSDHDLKHTAEDSRNTLGQKQDVSGVCGQCHVPHNGEDGTYLWSQKFGSGDDPIEQRCRSCHNPAGYAAHKNPELAKHPQQVKLWSNEIRKDIHPGKELPDTQVYDKNGKRTDFGNITCASCHNPHQWDASKNKEGPGKNLEGDARTSFLRARNSDNIVCAECHGNDAIYRYKYFHSESAHKKHHMFK